MIALVISCKGEQTAEELAGGSGPKQVLHPVDDGGDQCCPWESQGCRGGRPYDSSTSSAQPSGSWTLSTDQVVSVETAVLGVASMLSSWDSGTWYAADDWVDSG